MPSAYHGCPLESTPPAPLEPLWEAAADAGPPRRRHLRDLPYHFALPSHVTATGGRWLPPGASWARCSRLLEEGATHVGIATDHVIESFRNDLWPGYKTGEGMTPSCSAQFQLARGRARRRRLHRVPDGGVRGRRRHGGAAAVAAADPRVEKVVICTPDKDLGQCVVGDRVVQLDRRKDVEIGAAGVEERFGVRAGLDPRLPGAGRRLRRRLPRPAGLGGQVAPPACSPATATSSRSPRPPPTGTSACVGPGSSPPPSRTSSSWPCSSVASPPWSATPPRSPTSTSCTGPGPPPSCGGRRSDSTPPTSPARAERLAGSR